MLSRVFLINQGKCCGKKCMMCPYEKKHSGKSKLIRKSIINNLEPWERKEIRSGILFSKD